MTSTTPTPPCLGEREAVARTALAELTERVWRRLGEGIGEREMHEAIMRDVSLTLHEEASTLRTENETLRAERDAARETKRELHRRLQADEGPTTTRMERGEREAAFWLNARMEAGGRTSQALFRALTAEATVSDLTAKLAQAEGEIATMRTARPLEEYHADYGFVTWWKFPVEEPSWIGSPNCSDWPGYHTHWTPHPDVDAPALTTPEHSHGD